MKRLIFAALLALSATCASAQTSLQLHTVSHHFSERTNGKQWNEVNQGVGLRHALDKNWAVQAGFYRNSIDRWSSYAIGEYMATPNVGVFAGVRTNYTKPVSFAAGVVLRKAPFTFRISPKASNTGSAVVAVEIGWAFK